MDPLFWIGGLTAAIGAALVLYFVWPDLHGRDDRDRRE